MNDEIDKIDTYHHRRSPMKPKLLPNGLMVLDEDSHLSKWIEQCGYLDHDLTIRHRICPKLKLGDWVVDAGASLGDHTVGYAKAVGEAGKVFAFEPNPIAYGCLVHNMRPYPQMICSCAALSDGSTWWLRRDNVNVGATYFEPAPEGQGQAISITLDSYGLVRLDYMKIDVEGMELRVLKGAEGTLRKFRPLLFIELQRGHLARNGTTPKAIIDFLAKLDYRIEFLDPSHSLDMEQVDVFFNPL